MKKLNKKGFTIVELVIVIAVIAILAAVLIPTFSNVVEKAQISAAKSAPKHRSLHYIDDEDYDTLPEAKSNNKDSKGTTSMDLPEI